MAQNDAIVSGELAGTLRERVIIEQRLAQRDNLGGATAKYAYGGEAWAALSPHGIRRSDAG